jgi:putative tryptophan/tyrosine transport system substrate-binding protein
MRRREFIAGLGGAAAWPVVARGQQPTEKTKTIAVLMGFGETDSNAQRLVSAFREGLLKVGWAEGLNLRLELRWGAGDPERMRVFAQELVERRPDLILAQTTPVLRAVVHDTKTIPIVFAVVSDPIGGGFAANLSRPGGNVTGFTDAEPAMGGKWVQLLKEIAPRTTRASLLARATAASWLIGASTAACLPSCTPRAVAACRAALVRSFQQP